MKETILLSNPITINGKATKELTYDFNEITPIGFSEAEAKKMKASGSKGGNLSGAVELDYGLHLYLGFAAITAINPEIDFSDLERTKGRDVINIMKIGRNFIVSSAKSEESNLEDASEIMQEPSTPQ